MFSKANWISTVLIVSGAILLWLPSAAQARARGGGHGGGGRVGGGHGGGSHFGGSHFGGYHYGGGSNHYVAHGSYGYHPYSHYGYNYYPYYYGYGAYPAYPYGTYPSLAYDSGTTDTYASTPPNGSISAAAQGVPDNFAVVPAAPTPTDTRANIAVTAPADARIWFQDVAVNFRGPSEHFQSPPLAQGGQYVYEVRAAWTEDGKEVTQSQKVNFGPGERLTVTFPSPATTTATVTAAKTS
jgi:uncharacterized protein (TIGR03000 family)